METQGHKHFRFTHCKSLMRGLVTYHCIKNTNKKVILRKPVSRKKVVAVVPRREVKKVVKEVAKQESKDFGSRLNRNFAKPGLGKSIGDLILPGVGGALGHAAESVFRTIFGQGEYAYSDTISRAALPLNNTIVGQQTDLVKMSVDNMHWDGLATRIAHREYMGDITTTPAFNATLSAIYPTSSSMFPWLNTIAKNFQKWKLLGMVFEYVPTSSPIGGATPAMGSISMGVQYDTYLPAPTSLQQMLNWQGSVTGRPSDHLVCAVECDGEFTPTNALYIRQTGGSAAQNLTTFGNLIVAKSGAYDSYVGGQLWVSYDILLISAFVSNPEPLLPEPDAHQETETSQSLPLENTHTQTHKNSTGELVIITRV